MNMNERTENILEQDLLPEQAEWLLQSFKELSFDSAVNGDAYVNSFWSTAHPTTSLCKAINFDKIARLYCNVKGISYRCNSSDALYIVPSLQEGVQPEIYWIEFKNGKITSKVIKEIQEKIACESRILQDVESLNAGTLDVDALTLKAGTPEFNFGKKLKALGIPENTVSFEEKHAHFILVYNEEKKDELLEADVDAIFDAIDTEQYTDFIGNYNKAKRLPEVINKIDAEEGEEEKDTIKRYLKKGPRKMQWFQNVQGVFEILGAIIDGNYREEEEKWENLSDEEYERIIEVLEVYNRDLAKADEKSGLSKMISLLRKAIGKRNENQKAFASTAAEMLELSPKPVILIIEELRKYIYLKRLENNEYSDLVQIVNQNPVLKPIEFVGSDVDYIRQRIEEGTFDGFIRECGKENQYDSTLFLNRMTTLTVWPAAFFRFGLKNGFWYKDAKTYSRREFKENFIDGICKMTGDINALNFAT